MCAMKNPSEAIRASTLVEKGQFLARQLEVSLMIPGKTALKIEERH